MTRRRRADVSLILLGIGLVLAFEGLVFALLPGRLEELVRAIAAMPHETRRMVGLIAVGLGTLLIWVSRLIG